MIAYLGLSSRPAQVQGISADWITLLSDSPCPLGSTTAIELASDTGFRCILSMRVTRVEAHPNRGYNIDGEFARRLTAEELRDLSF
jgi:hypothetical protein